MNGNLRFEDRNLAITGALPFARNAKRGLERRPLSVQVLADQNRHFRRTGGVSQENQAYGFLPAFMDIQSGAIYLSRFADGRLAPIHLLEGLPENVIAARTPSGTVTAASGSVIAGFVSGRGASTRGRRPPRRSTGYIHCTHAAHLLIV